MDSPSIEELKKAQQQLKESQDFHNKNNLSKRNPPFTISRVVSEKQRDYNPPSPATSFGLPAQISKKFMAGEQNLGGQATSFRSSLRSERAPIQKPKEDAQGTEDWLSHQDWLKEISDERQRLEKIYKEIENRQKKVQERLAIVKEIEDQGQRINKELKDLQQKIVLVKKENNTIIYQIKNEHGNNDIKNDSEK